MPPALGSNSEVTTGEASTAQLPVIVSGCFITTSGKCLHTAVCHHGKRAEVKTLAVKICTKCLSNDIRRFPHTSEVYVDWNDCVHQSRVCEDFHRRYSHLSDIAVKRIVKKCRHCFLSIDLSGTSGRSKRCLLSGLCKLHFSCTSEKPCVDCRCLHVCGSSRISFVSCESTAESLEVRECLRHLMSVWTC